MLTPDQWAVALANKIPEALATATVSREVQAFLVQFKREEGYSTTELGKAMVPAETTDKDTRARFFRLLVNVRNELPEWAIIVGLKRYMGRDVNVYVWQAPHNAKIPDGAMSATCCPTCGNELF
jgi:hypothetical protein